MSRERTGALAWEVLLPERGAAPLGGRKPCGTLVIHDEAGDERISLPAAVARLLSSKQKSGEVNPESRSELRYLTGELARACARTRIQRLIDRHEYSTTEIRQKLSLDGYASSTIDACLARACEAGLVSDMRFADSFIRSKLSAGWGDLRIRRELMRRGIDVDEVPGWPYEYFDPEDEVERACSLARTRSIASKNPYEKLVRYLVGRGFGLGVAKRAARMVIDEREQEEW